jgi:Tfp pilus assembly protein FimV
VRSALGQQLNATVPVRLGAGEALTSACVVPGKATSNLRRVPGASVTTPEATREGQYELRVSSASALYEPMYELELKVKCPGAPVVVRQYVLMLDLPAAIASSAAASPDAASPQAAVSATATLPDAEPASPAVEPRPARPRATTTRAGTTIASGSVYRVSDGDTLSGIAARVRDRNVSLGVLADAIQAANPDAFIRNDADLIKLGSEILIPAAAATSATATGSLPAAVTTPVVPPAPAAWITASQHGARNPGQRGNAAGQIAPAQAQAAQVQPTRVKRPRFEQLPCCGATPDHAENSGRIHRRRIVAAPMKCSVAPPAPASCWTLHQRPALVPRTSPIPSASGSQHQFVFTTRTRCARHGGCATGDPRGRTRLFRVLLAAVR